MNQWLATEWNPSNLDVIWSEESATNEEVS